MTRSSIGGYSPLSDPVEIAAVLTVSGRSKTRLIVCLVCDLVFWWIDIVPGHSGGTRELSGSGHALNSKHFRNLRKGLDR